MPLTAVDKLHRRTKYTWRYTHRVVTAGHWHSYLSLFVRNPPQGWCYVRKCLPRGIPRVPLKVCDVVRQVGVVCANYQRVPGQL